MIETFRGIWRFAGEEQRNIRRSVIACFFNAVFHMFEIAAIYYTILALLDGKTGSATAWQALGLLAVSILGSAVTKYFSQLQQTHAGYFMAANKRVAIGQRMKSVPMGYFNDNSLGELTGVCTTVLDNVETVAPMVLVTMLGGMLNALVFTVMILIFDWRIGLIVVAATAVYLFITSRHGAKSAAPRPAPSEVRGQVGVEAVLEYVQGMSVVKSFNLTGRGDHTLQEALEYNCRSNLNIEKDVHPLYHGAGDRAPAGKRGHDALSGMVLSLRDHDPGQRPDGGHHVLPGLCSDLLGGQRHVPAASAAHGPLPMRRTPCPTWLGYGRARLASGAAFPTLFSFHYFDHSPSRGIFSFTIYPPIEDTIPPEMPQTLTMFCF